MTEIAPARPQLSREQQRELETLLRHQIAAVRATCALLQRPSPLIGGDDQRHDRKERRPQR